MTGPPTRSTRADRARGSDLKREPDERLESAHPREVLATTAAYFPTGRLAVVSAFGPGTMVLLDMLADLKLRLPVVFIDTLHHFPETLEHVERARRLYDLDLREYRAAEDRAAFEAQYGERLWERDLAAYQQLTKVEPFRRATRDLNAFITGRRRDQTATRAAVPVIERPHVSAQASAQSGPSPVHDGLAAGSASEFPIRINPLAHWSRTDVWEYIERRGVPVNALHDQGYTSIGDAQLTTPVAPGEHERAGRWRGAGVLECGIHTLGSC